MNAVQKSELEEKEILEDLEELEAIPEAESADKGVSSDEQKSPDVPASAPVRKSRRLPPLLRLTRRTNVFLSFTLIATVLFFIMGNRQTFLDANLSLILQIIACTAIALSFFSFAGVIECIFYFLKLHKVRVVVHLVCYALIFIVSVSFSVLSLTINLLSEGIDF